MINEFELGYFDNQLLRNDEEEYIKEYRINEIEKKSPTGIGIRPN